MDEQDVEISAPVDAPLPDEVAQPVAPEAPPVEGAEVEKETPGEPTAPEADARPKSRTQQRIDELTRKAGEAERALQAEREYRQRVEQQAYQLWQAQQAAQAQATKPRLEQFQSVEDYERAVWEHFNSHTNAQRQMEADAAKRRQEQDAAEAQLRYIEGAISEGEKKYPDFRAVITNPALPPLARVNPALHRAILESEQGLDVAYYLGKNLAEAHRIASLQPIAALRELGHIEAKLRQPSRAITAAPPPVTTVGSNESATKDPSKMSYEEYRRWRLGNKG